MNKSLELSFAASEAPGEGVFIEPSDVAAGGGGGGGVGPVGVCTSPA